MANVNHCKLCESCRRTCKQMAITTMLNCPRYYPYKNKVRVEFKQWIQQSFSFTTKIKMLTKKDVEENFKTRLTQQLYGTTKN